MVSDETTSLPSYYYQLYSKRGIAVTALRKYEKLVLKTAKIESEVEFWQRCMDLNLYPNSIKFKPPKNQLYTCMDEVYHVMEKKSLKQARKELEITRKFEIKLSIKFYLDCPIWKKKN